MTAGRTALFSGLTVAAAMAALIFMPQRFLYSMAVAGASVAVLSSVIAILVVPSLLSLLGTRIDALSIRRGPAVSDESGGWYRLARGVMRRPVARRPRQRAPCSWLRGAAALDDPDRAERRSRAPGPALLRRLPLPRSPLPARRHRGGHGRRRRRRPRPSWPPTSGGSRRSEASSAARPSCRPARTSPTPTSPSPRPALSERVAGRRQRDPRPPPARLGTGPRLRQHGPLHRPEAEPARTRAAGGRDHLPSPPWSSSSCSPARCCCR